MKLRRASLTCFALLSLSSCNSRPSPQNEEDAKAFQAKREEAMATLINVKGHLCAKVIFVSPEIDTGERQVSCNEFRNPKKAKSKHNMIIYMVNMRTGTVKVMGGG